MSSTGSGTGPGREPEPAHLAALDDALGFLGDRLRRDHPLGPLCTYRVGGRAARYVEPAGPDELAAVARAVSAAGPAAGAVRILVVGAGSNLLVADEGFPGVAVHLGPGFADVVREGTSLRAGAAASLPVVARRSVAEGLTGFEWAVGVPGSIGGAVRMNAGGHGSDMAASLRGIRVVDLRSGETSSMDAAALELAYRSSSLPAHAVVVEATLDLAEGDPVAGEATLSEIVRWRRENQPGGRNAGSVFTNPPGDSAGRLVEAAGLKGLRIGTAAVSDKHANFIQADEGGSAHDVFAVMVEVARGVRERFGVTLHPETVLVGFEPFEEALA